MGAFVRTLRAIPFAGLLSIVGSPSVAHADPPWFSPSGQFVPSSNLSTVRWTFCDVDGDGRQDLVGIKGAEIHVGIGDGNSNFAFSVAALPQDPLTPFAPVVARLDADPFPDLLFVDSSTGSCSVSWGDGLGNFTAGPNSPTIATSVDPVAFDFDADGVSEIALVRSTGKLEVLRVDSNGWQVAATTPSLSGTIRVLQHGDCDGDGLEDLIVGSVLGGNGTLRVLRGNGASAFVTSTTLAMPTGFGIGARVQPVDLDSDGDLDVAVQPASGNATVPTFKNDGTGAFTSAAAVLLPATHFTFDDLDDDGFVDLVGGTQAQLNVGWNDGTGGFAIDPVSYAIPNPLASPALVRLDGDAFPEFVFSQTNGGVAAKHARVFVARGIGPGRWALSPGFSPSTAPHGFGAADLDGDGDDDAVGLLGLGLTQYKNDGVDLLTPLPTVTTHATATIRFADLDQDGLLDGLAAGNLAGKTPYGVAVARNQHGVLATTTLASATSPGLIANGVDFTVGDFDGDGDEDAFVTASSMDIPGSVTPHTLRGLRNQGGNLVPSPILVPAIGGLDTTLHAVASADADNDGDLDLFVVDLDPATGDVTLLRNDGAGGMIGAVTLPIDVSNDLHSLQVVDVDGDGNVDVVGGVFLNQIQVLPGLGGGVFAAAMDLGLPGYSDLLRFADFDGDGRLDVVALGDSSVVHVLEQVNPFSFALTQLVAIAFGSWTVVPCEADGDGRIDLVATRSNSNRPFLIRRACAGDTAPSANACAGSGGIAPSLTAHRCPLAGQTIEFEIDDALGGTRGFLLISTGVTPIPFKTGCALDLNFPVTKVATFATSGFGPGNGEASIAYPLPLALAGTTFAAQAGVRDPASPNQAVVTNAVVVDVE
ncbi:MAG: VCBS repeat-containing protein [Planctomycetes bacterium]|nr:VCBS repeat-containing protein [Planctomycetota bacterium]